MRAQPRTVAAAARAEPARRFKEVDEVRVVPVLPPAESVREAQPTMVQHEDIPLPREGKADLVVPSLGGQVFAPLRVEARAARGLATKLNEAKEGALT